MMSLVIRLVEPRSESTPLQAVAHPSASAAIMVTTISKTEEEEASNKPLEDKQQVAVPQVLVLQVPVAVDLKSRQTHSALMQIWMRRKRNIKISNKLPVRALTQPLLSPQVLQLLAWRALLRPTMLLETRSAELQSESMLPLAANLVSLSEDECSFEMREMAENQALKEQDVRYQIE